MIDKQKQHRRQNAWNKDHYERVYLNLPKGRKDRWKALADRKGMSLNEFVVRCVEIAITLTE